jgi:hypothetical protein
VLVVVVVVAVAVAVGGEVDLVVVLGYSHAVLRNLQERHAGLASSHFTLRALQFLQPALDFL